MTLYEYPVDPRKYVGQSFGDSASGGGVEETSLFHTAWSGSSQTYVCVPSQLLSAFISIFLNLDIIWVLVFVYVIKGHGAFLNSLDGPIYYNWVIVLRQ